MDLEQAGYHIDMIQSTSLKCLRISARSEYGKIQFKTCFGSVHDVLKNDKPRNIPTIILLQPLGYNPVRAPVALPSPTDNQEIDHWRLQVRD